MSGTDDSTSNATRANGKAVPADRREGSIFGRTDLETDRFVEEIHSAYGESYQDLLTYARRRVKSLEEAHDIVQQAFTNTLTAVEQGTRIRNVGGFLYRCVQNLCVDHELVEPPLVLDEEIFSMPEEPTVAFTELKLQCREVNSALDGLAPDKRRAFVLAELKGLGCKEIAESMGRSTESVWQLLSRARREIRLKVGAGSDWIGSLIPALGAERWLICDRQETHWQIPIWIRAKMTELTSTMVGVFQRSTEVLQPSVPVAVSAVAIVLASAPFPQVDRELPSAAEPAPAEIKRSVPAHTQARKNPVDSRNGKAAPTRSGLTRRPSGAAYRDRRLGTRKEHPGRTTQSEAREVSDRGRENIGNADEDGSSAQEAAGESRIDGGVADEGLQPQTMNRASAANMHPIETSGSEYSVCTATPGSCSLDDSELVVYVPVGEKRSSTDDNDGEIEGYENHNIEMLPGGAPSTFAPDQ